MSKVEEDIFAFALSAEQRPPDEEELGRRAKARAEARAPRRAQAAATTKFRAIIPCDEDILRFVREIVARRREERARSHA